MGCDDARLADQCLVPIFISTAVLSQAYLLSCRFNAASQMLQVTSATRCEPISLHAAPATSCTDVVSRWLKQGQFQTSVTGLHSSNFRGTELSLLGENSSRVLHAWCIGEATIGLRHKLLDGSASCLVLAGFIWMRCSEGGLPSPGNKSKRSIHGYK